MYKGKAYKVDLSAVTKAMPAIDAMTKAITEAKQAKSKVKAAQRKLNQAQKAVLDEYSQVRALIKQMQDQDINPSSAQQKLKVLDDIEKEVSELLKESKNI